MRAAATIAILVASTRASADCEFLDSYRAAVRVLLTEEERKRLDEPQLDPRYYHGGFCSPQMFGSAIASIAIDDVLPLVIHDEAPDAETFLRERRVGEKRGSRVWCDSMEKSWPKSRDTATSVARRIFQQGLATCRSLAATEDLQRSEPIDFALLPKSEQRKHDDDHRRKALEAAVVHATETTLAALRTGNRTAVANVVIEQIGVLVRAWNR
jgi:hypothetical protein